jgi:polyhydroxybutyrate depolymerase
MMTFRLAIELDPPITAFAAVCSSMADNGICSDPTHKISALLIDGTADPLVPYRGGQVHFYKKQRGSVISIDKVVTTWCNLDGIIGEPVVMDIPHHDTFNKTRAKKITYAAHGGYQVELIRIENGGHVEPSISQKIRLAYGFVVGKQNHDFESAEMAWSFFKDKVR